MLLFPETSAIAVHSIRCAESLIPLLGRHFSILAYFLVAWKLFADEPKDMLQFMLKYTHSKYHGRIFNEQFAPASQFAEIKKYD